MYDLKVTSNYLSQLKPFVVIEEKSGPKEIPFELEYHTPSQVQQANAFFDDLINLQQYNDTKETSNVKIELKDKTRKFDVDELLWIENERLLCKWDADYFLTRYYHYLNIEGIYKLFEYLVPQKVNMMIIAEQEKLQQAIRKFTVKARQQGETTWSQGIILQRLAFFSDVVSMIASYEKDPSGEMSKKFTAAMNKLPWWNRPHLKSFLSEQEYTYDNGSNFDLGWGTQSSLGRGRTAQVAHLSEIPFYQYPEKAIEESLLNQMHETIWEIVLMEGTAEGRDNYFHRKYKEIIQGMESGLTSFIFSFHPWCARGDIYPTETWIRARSYAYEKWNPSQKTIDHAEKLRKWVSTNKYYSQLWGSNWKLSREQMFYYEVERNNAVKNNVLNTFLKEKPSDPEEAFQHPGQTIYPVQTLLNMSDFAQQKIPQVFKLRGDPREVPPQYWPEESEIKYDGELITIRCNWNPAIPYMEFELVEVNFNGWDSFDPMNKILIWEHPKLGFEYGTSFDSSDGLGRNVSNDAVIEVIRKGTVQFKDKQVCEFASPEIPQSMMWPWLLAIMTYYSPEEQCLYSPEINKGTECLTALEQRGWGNIFSMYDSAKLNQGIVQGTKFGFETNRRTRNALITHMNAFIMGNWCEIYSLPLIVELKDLEKKRIVNPTIGAENEKILGKVDNRFMAFGIGLYALHRDSILGLQKAPWEERIKNQNSIVRLKSYKIDPLAVDAEVQRWEDMIAVDDEIDILISEDYEEGY